MVDFDSLIEQAVQDPAEAQTDAGRAKAHPLPDVLKVEEHQKKKSGITDPRRGVRYSKYVPPGAT